MKHIDGVLKRTLNRIDAAQANADFRQTINKLYGEDIFTDETYAEPRKTALKTNPRDRVTKISKPLDLAV